MTSTHSIRRPGGKTRSRVIVEAASASSLTPGPLTHTARTPDNVDCHRYYAEFTSLVHRLIRQYGQDVDLREELTGELYCRFCTLLERFEPCRGVPLRPYIVHQLSLAAYTFARQHWRLKKREIGWEFVENHLENETAGDPTPEWLSTMVRKQVAQALPAALEKLPARQRDIVIWRYFEELSFEEIGETLAIRPVTARSMLRHALKNLRAVIQVPEGF